jgi:hypothetical protein
MKIESTKGVDSDEILRGFASLLSQHQEASERRQAKSDAKLDKLVETVTTLTQSHIETRKDREYDIARMERLDQNQKDQGEKMSEMANQLILINERQSNTKTSFDRITGISNSVILAAILAYMGLK